MLAMSSHDDPETEQRALAAGFDRYLPKPVSPDAIRRAVAELTRTDQVLLDPDLSSESLAGRIESLVDHGERLASMAERSGSFGRPDAAERLADLVEEAAA